MKRWLRRIRGALGMGFSWAVVWTVVGMTVMIIADTLFGFDADVVDIWIPVFAYPAFLGGMTFSAILAIAGGRRRLDEMSLPRFAGWGALGGLVLTFPIAAMLNFSPLAMGVAGAITLMCSGSAAGSLALARVSEHRELTEVGGEVGAVGLTEGEERELLGG